MPLFTSEKGSAIPPGRTKEAGEVEHVLRAVESGEKRGIHLTGSPGIGKTTLLHWAKSQALHAGFLCSFVRAPLTGGLPPRFPLAEVLVGVMEAHHAAGLPVPEPLDETAGALRGSDAPTRRRSNPPDLLHIAAAIRACSTTARIGIFIDDIQWAPLDATKALLTALRVVDRPIFFASAARSPTEAESTPSPPPESTADLPIQYLELGGLDLDSVSELAAETLAGPVLPSLVRELHRRTLGNPLFALETLRHWLAVGSVKRLPSRICA